MVGDDEIAAGPDRADVKGAYLDAQRTLAREYDPVASRSSGPSPATQTLNVQRFNGAQVKPNRALNSAFAASASATI